MKSITLLIFIVCSAVCSATEHTYTISGILTTINSPIYPYLTSGNVFSLSMKYNTETPSSHTFGTVQNTYALDSVTLKLTHGDTHELYSANSLNKVVVSRGFTSGVLDGFQFYVYFPGDFGFSQMMVYANIDGHFKNYRYGTAPSLPLDSLDSIYYSSSDLEISGWTPSAIIQTFGRIANADDRETAVPVPEPATYSLFFACVSVILCFIKKRRANC